MGLFFPPERWMDLERKLQAAAPALGYADVEACAQFLTSTAVTKQQLDLLASHLTVGETYFFREPRSLEALERHILPELVADRYGGNQQLRFWSAACCTGEEPYSLAILLKRLLPDLSAWQTTILATDISQRFLHKAKEGVYGQWSFRGVSPALRERHFSRTPGGLYAIHSELKQMVNFAQLNLVEDPYPASANDTVDMDVILCRNVLIYFTAERIKHIIEQFYHALVDGGWLIVSPVETAFVMDSPFIPVQFPGVTLFRKDTKRKAVPFVFPAGSSSPRIEFIDNTIGAHETDEVVLDDAPDAHRVDSEDVAPLPDATQDAQPLPSPVQEAPPSPYEEACALYARGNYTDVIEKLQEAYGPVERHSPLLSNPALEQVMALLARAYANQGQLVEARDWCDQALAVNKCNAGLHYLRATILLECGQETEARLSLTRALYLDQHFILAHFTLGNLARQRKEFREAGRHFQNALMLLQGHQPEDILPESEGMSAGRLAQIITDMSKRL